MSTSSLVLTTTVSLLFATALAAQDQSPAPLKAGMIGLDTSHVPAFVRLFNTAKPESDLATIKIVAGYPGGTDLPASRDRVAKFTDQVKGMGVEIVDTIPELLKRVDIVLIESVDGRIHLQEAIPVIKAGKPLWIDKPLAGSLADVLVIFDLAKKHNVPVFSSSSLRYGASIQSLAKSEKVGDILGASTWGPCSYSTGTPDMFFYGIHGIEPLYTLMGTGCQTVSRVQASDADFITGVWEGGRVGTYRGIRKGASQSGAVAYGSKSIGQAEKGGGYDDLCRQIVKFFKTGQSPVAAEETIEIFTFMEAADESKRQGGAPVKLSDVLAKARREADAKLAQQ